MKELGHKLKNARSRTPLTQQDVAARLGVSKPTVITLESDESNPNAETLKMLSKMYGESADYLLGLDRKRALFIDDLTDEEIDALHNLATIFRKARGIDYTDPSSAPDES